MTQITRMKNKALGMTDKPLESTANLLGVTGKAFETAQDLWK